MTESLLSAVFTCAMHICDKNTYNSGGELKMNCDELQKRISYSDLVWDRFPHIWYEGAFVGNGIYGASVYHNENEDLIVKLGHTKIFDNRTPTEIEKDPLYLVARLPIGFFKLTAESKAVKCAERLDIFKAETKGTVDTENGRYSFKVLALRNRDIVLMDFESENENAGLSFVPFSACSPRLTHMIEIKDDNRMSKEYFPPRESRDFSDGGIFYHVQPYYNGGFFTTAYKTVKNGNGTRLFVTTQTGDTEAETVELCRKEITETENNIAFELEAHYKWWADFYKTSTLKISAVEYEEFYNIQLYKAASSSAPNGRVFDTCGVWISEDTAWPAAFWNLNVELSYSPLYTSGHLDLAHSLTNEIHNGTQDMRNNVPEKYRSDSYAIGRNTGRGLAAPVLNPGEPGPDKQHEAGNLTWALFYCMKEYRICEDKTILSETVYPVLKGAVQYYLHFLYTGEDGLLHLPRTVSPEYIGIIGGDCNYDLSLLRWALLTLPEICEILDLKDEMIPVWKETYDRLCDYPHDDDEGFYISAETKYGTSHRHYSHLLMFYPLNLLDLDNQKERKLAETSLNFWQSKPEALEGYSQTGGGAMRALLGDGNGALNHLKRLWQGFILPNTMYRENISPVLETPLAAAATIQEMLLQSHNGIIRVFPALPDEWKDVEFTGFLCEGGFSLCAKAHEGRITKLTIKSLLGNRCIVKAHIDELVKSSEKITPLGENQYQFNLLKGEEISLKDDAFCEETDVDSELLNCYGLNKAHDKLTKFLKGEAK